MSVVLVVRAVVRAHQERADGREQGHLTLSFPSPRRLVSLLQVQALGAEAVSVDVLGLSPLAKEDPNQRRWSSGPAPN